MPVKNKKKITELMKERRIYLDGGTGSVLQGMGLKPGEGPENWNLTNPDKILSLYNAYLDAGSDVFNTNTFGVNKLKYDNYDELIKAAINLAHKACEGREEKYIAFDMGPTGRLLEPLGDLSFEDAVDVFASNIKVAKECDVDLVIIETMNDSLETKAALLAVKENCDLPVFVMNVYDEGGKLMTGASPEAMVAMLEGMGADAVGMNCSLGPDKMINTVKRFAACSSLPIIVKPNAGLPEVRDGKTVYNVDAEEFSTYMAEIAEIGATILGGCCGSTPEYIAKLIEKTKDLEFRLPGEKDITLVSAYTNAVEIAEKPILIGERINPTGKKKVKEALRTENLSYILDEALKQVDAGAHILDVNVGLPEIDEATMMVKVVKEIQSVTDVPLQLDSSSPEVLAAAMRIYNGKALINSVNGEQEKMDAVFPLVKKYGGTLIALTMDENGIPKTAEERIAVVNKIVDEAKKYGIETKDIIVDPLALTISSDTSAALETLKTVKMLKEMGIKSSLGVSNISFGLPKREKITTTFYTCALENGLNCAIMNPYSRGMMDAFHTFKALHNMDEACQDYIEYADSIGDEVIVSGAAVKTGGESITQNSSQLHYAVVKGMKESAIESAKTLLENTEPLTVINEHIIPALNEIGAAFEKGKAYLPQLLMSAEAASAAFEEVKAKLPATEGSSKGEVVLCTVKGDIHDIGKNIVKVMLESYGFTVYDLGKDVDPQLVLDACIEHGTKLVGLSALMTTTVPAMADTIKLLHEHDSEITVMVGGAVLTQDYADMIHADFYGKDAMDTVRFTEKYYNK
ncbi:MAG: homocysteine S-methyltransferase family protein [Clostridia bacterium]|nr:homocysteine S-methyltransferase family protein [Clostridia bacterium]